MSLQTPVYLEDGVPNILSEKRIKQSLDVAGTVILYKASKYCINTRRGLFHSLVRRRIACRTASKSWEHNWGAVYGRPNVIYVKNGGFYTKVAVVKSRLWKFGTGLVATTTRSSVRNQCECFVSHRERDTLLLQQRWVYRGLKHHRKWGALCRYILRSPEKC